LAAPFQLAVQFQARNETRHSMVEYKEAAGKAIKRLRFTNDEDFRTVCRLISRTAPH